MAFSSIFDSKFCLGRSLYLIQETRRNPNDESSAISSAVDYL
jgi:hypothetical protein